MRLSPLDPRSYITKFGLAIAHFIAAALSTRRWAGSTQSLQEQPRYVPPLRYRVSPVLRPYRPACGGAGSVAASCCDLFPTLTIGKLLGDFGRLQYVRNSARGSRAGLRLAGLGEETMSQTRRLAAILAADVAGYSRLIGADEGGTLERLKALRRELLDPKIAEHKGRLVKTTGDGLLVEFGSVVDALRCAVEVQREMAGRNAGVPPDNRIEFRIGINVGDIVVEDGDIFGDGVNVAARLEGLAEPGGICVSARVQEDAAGKLDLAFEDIGEQQLKNIARPVRVYRVRHGRRPYAGVSAPALPASRQAVDRGAALRRI